MTGQVELRCAFGGVELRAEPSATEGEPAKKKIVGYASLFAQPYWIGSEKWGWWEEIAPGAFSESLGADDIRALIDHDMGRLIGRNKSGTLRLKEDPKGLQYEIDPPDTTLARDLMTLMARGDITGSSIGFRVLSESWTLKDGKDYRQLQKIRLYDVGPVTFPANAATEAMLRSAEPVRERRSAGLQELAAMRLRVEAALAG